MENLNLNVRADTNLLLNKLRDTKSSSR